MFIFDCFVSHWPLEDIFYFDCSCLSNIKVMAYGYGLWPVAYLAWQLSEFILILGKASRCSILNYKNEVCDP